VKLRMPIATIFQPLILLQQPNNCVKKSDNH
jgi:hypothetical protein